MQPQTAQTRKICIRTGPDTKGVEAIWAKTPNEFSHTRPRQKGAYQNKTQTKKESTQTWSRPRRNLHREPRAQGIYTDKAQTNNQHKHVQISWNLGLFSVDVLCVGPNAWTHLFQALSVQILLYLGFVCVCSFGVWALSLQISFVLGLLHGFFCSRHCLCSFLCGVCLRRFRLCPGLVCVDYFCSGPYLCRFIVLWALCVNSFFVWALFVGFLLCVGLVRFTNKAQTHKQPTQTVPTTEESMQ